MSAVDVGLIEGFEISMTESDCSPDVHSEFKTFICHVANHRLAISITQQFPQIKVNDRLLNIEANFGIQIYSGSTLQDAALLSISGGTTITIKSNERHVEELISNALEIPLS